MNYAKYFQRKEKSRCNCKRCIVKEEFERKLLFFIFKKIKKPRIFLDILML